MAEKLFDLYRSDTGKSLIVGATMSEVRARQATYRARGGKAMLETVTTGSTYLTPEQRAEVRKVPEILTDQDVGDATQLSMAETGVEPMQVIGKTAALAAAQYIEKWGGQTVNGVYLKNYSDYAIVKIALAKGRLSWGQKKWLLDTFKDMILEVQIAEASEEG